MCDVDWREPGEGGAMTSRRRSSKPSDDNNISKPGFGTSRRHFSQSVRVSYLLAAVLVYSSTGTSYKVILFGVTLPSLYKRKLIYSVYQY